MRSIIHQLRRALLPGVSDGQLLGYYVDQRDEAAFEALVRRHGPMVLGVCKLFLSDPHDADDAFQTTFLVLVQKAEAIAPRELVASWLFGVARQTAIRMRAARAKRRRRERQVVMMPERAASSGDLRAVLDEELSNLPEPYRVAIILCDLEGRTRKEAARLLGWPEGSVSSRLARGRALLGKRLVQHGVGGPWAVSLPGSLVVSTLRAAAQRVLPEKVAALGNGVASVMSLSEAKIAVAVWLTSATLALWGVGLVAHTVPVAPQGHPSTDVKEPAPPQPAAQEDRLKSLIDKALNAHGGEERLRGLRVFTQRQKETDPGNAPREVRLFVQLPSRLRQEVELSGGKWMIAVRDGQWWWWKNGDKATQEGRAKDPVQDVLLPSAWPLVLNLKDPAFKARWAGESKVCERAAVCLELARQDDRDFPVPSAGLTRTAKLFFDAESGRLLKHEAYVLGVGRVEIFYDDYRVWSGMPLACTETRVVNDREKGKAELLDFKILDKLDDKLFEKP